MAFTTILAIVLPLWVLLYIGLFVYDLFIRKDPVDLIPKTEDVEVDITDEAGQFSPIIIEKDPIKTVSVAQTADAIKQSDEVRIDNARETNKTQSEREEDQTAPDENSHGDIQKDNIPHENEANIGPQPADEETRRRIQELVRLNRQEMLAEELMGDEDDGTQTQETRSKSEDTEQSKPKEGTPSEVAQVAHSAQKAQSAQVAYYQPKAPERPPYPKPAFFDFKICIHTDSQKTRLRGGQTVEQLSGEVRRASIDEILMTTKAINNRWEKVEMSRQPDEDELAAIEKARAASPAQIPKF